MTTLNLAGRVLRASADDRIVTYLLAPFGEPGRTSLGKVTLTASSMTIPEDVTGLTVNLEHDPKVPVGKFARVEATAKGYEADVRFLATRAGDDALTEAREGVRRGISVEVDNPVIRAGRMLAGLLSGAGVCATPAYPSALMTAADAGDLPEDFPEWQLPSESSTESTDEITFNGVTYVVKRTTTSKTEVDPKPGATPQEPDQPAESEAPVGNSLTAAAVTAAGVPAPVNPAEKKSSAEQVFRMLASSYQTGGEKKLTAALADIVHDDGDNDGDGLGEITAAPEWLREVWSQVAYSRRWIPLIASAPLTSYRQKGFHFGTKPLVQKWAGNKTEVPTGGMTATPVDYTTTRWAHAADLDRRYVDFGDSDVIRAFTEAQLESYKKETDLDVHDGLFTLATAFTPGSVPAGVDAGLAALIDGALDLVGRDLNPTFAIVGTALYRNLLFTMEQKGLKFLTMALGLEEGSLDGFKIRPSGRAAAANKVLVGDGATVVFKEFGGGSPVRVDAEEVAKGGRDLGLFGYSSLQDRTPASVAGVVVANLGA